MAETVATVKRQLLPGTLWEAFPPDQKALQHGLLSQGWSVRQWAEQAGLSEPTARRFLRGKPTKPQSAYKLILALKLNPAKVFQEKAAS
jgi:hypothetical protein